MCTVCVCCDLRRMIHPFLHTALSTLYKPSTSELPKGSLVEEEDMEKNPEELSPLMHRSLTLTSHVTVGFWALSASPSNNFINH